ncbi:MAG: hypothetical protein ABIA91_00730 [Patescibacteria group bacterium]
MINIEKQEKTPKPNLMDIVEIDGDLAQVIVAGDTVKYLDSKEDVAINWDDYDYTPFSKGKSATFENVFNVGDLCDKGMITKKQYASIVYSTLDEDPQDICKKFVKVFGKYTKKI